MFGYWVGYVKVASGGIIKVVTQVRDGNLAWSDRVLIR